MKTSFLFQNISGIITLHVKMYRHVHKIVFIDMRLKRREKYILNQKKISSPLPVQKQFYNLTIREICVGLMHTHISKNKYIDKPKTVLKLQRHQKPTR